MQEKRKARRYPKTIETTIENQQGTQSSTTTRNISACGTYLPKNGASVRLHESVTVTLFFNKNQSCIKTRGTIVRTDENGFAVNFFAMSIAPCR